MTSNEEHLLFDARATAAEIQKLYEKALRQVDTMPKTPRIACWRHRWGEWDQIEGKTTWPNGATGIGTRQFRKCGRCGYIQMKKLS